MRDLEDSPAFGESQSRIGEVEEKERVEGGDPCCMLRVSKAERRPTAC